MKRFPGSIIDIENSNASDFLNILFLGGDIVMAQIKSITGLGTPTLQNWVNRGFLPNPKGKKYNKNQLARILIINSLRKTVKLDDIDKLLFFVNGNPNDESDDIIEESTLYVLICNVCQNSEFSLSNVDKCVIEALSQYNERTKGAKKRLEIALKIICQTLIANDLLDSSEELFFQITNQNSTH